MKLLGMSSSVARFAWVMALGWLTVSCSGPPKHTARAPQPIVTKKPSAVPKAKPPRAAFDDGVDVRVCLALGSDSIELECESGFRIVGSEISLDSERLIASPTRDRGVAIRDFSGRRLRGSEDRVRLRPLGRGFLHAHGRPVRGEIELTSRSDTLFVVNILPLEDYLRGVVPREIGPRDPSLIAAVAAQAVAARTYTVKRLEQYNGFPFDLYDSVMDQVYEGVAGEDAVADQAILMTRSLVLADESGLIEAYYSSTCGGQRSDIGVVWPHREPFHCLRGGPDGSPAWCKASRHFRWEETWSGWKLSKLVREHLAGQINLAPGKVRGELIDLRVTGRGPSGRLAGLEYVTTKGRWVVPGDRNRWILRREDTGGILRSVLIELEVEKKGGRVVHVRAAGGGNGHGVGLCQMGALGRAEAGQEFREILTSYYPGVRIRPIRGQDLPPGRPGAS